MLPAKCRGRNPPQAGPRPSRALDRPRQMGLLVAPLPAKILESESPPVMGSRRICFKMAAALGFGALRLSRVLGLKNQHCRVFGKVHSALLALPTLELHMLAGGAGIFKRGMAPHAIGNRLRILRLAFTALHDKPGISGGRFGPFSKAPSQKPVNPSQRRQRNQCLFAKARPDPLFR